MDGWNDDGAPLSDETLAEFASRLETLPLDEAVWVARLLRECLRARASEAVAQGQSIVPSDAVKGVEQGIAQVVLDAAEWLQTLWDVGYMGAGHFPATPRSAFPSIDTEDILKSALLARIRDGRRPLPFPPPTREGKPWHEVVESDETFIVEATLIRDESGLVGAIVEACTDWVIREEVKVDGEYLIQHQGKGPVYRLSLDPFCSRLERLPPATVRKLCCQERANFRTYYLDWPDSSRTSHQVELRAQSWDRAESAALHWIAVHHPDLYGQIRFERVDLTPVD